MKFIIIVGYIMSYQIIFRVSDWFLLDLVLFSVEYFSNFVIEKIYSY